MMPALRITLLLCLTTQAVTSAAERLDKPVQDCTVSFEDNGACVCSSLNPEGPVKCQNGSSTVEIQPCYCAYFDQAINKTVVGNCYYTCYQSFDTVVNVMDSGDFNDDFCSYDSINRRGFFCYECNHSYALGVYSNLAVQCLYECEYHGFGSWVKYFAIALLPLTLFYVLAVFLSFNITSSSFGGVILVIQCITTSPLRTIFYDGANPKLNSITKFVIALLEIINFDFFRSYSFTNVCLNPDLTVLGQWSLSFIVALYPFLLIFITYLLVTAYDKEYRVLIWMWKPFKKCLHHYRKSWNIHNSLVEIFCSFVLLSSAKILKVSFLILSWTSTYDIYGNKVQDVVTLTANVKYFGTEHAPYALLSISVSFLFVILPILLLLLYPCRYFHKCLNLCKLRLLPLHMFMDVFQGSYKLQPYDMRYFSALYLLLRLVFLAHARLFLSEQTLYISGIIALVASALVITCRPYKVAAHNVVDFILLLLLGIYFLSSNEASLLQSLGYDSQATFSRTLQGFSLSLIVMYLVLLIIWKLLGKKAQVLITAIKSKLNILNLQQHRGSFNLIESAKLDNNTSDTRGEYSDTKPLIH